MCLELRGRYRSAIGGNYTLCRVFLSIRSLLELDKLRQYEQWFLFAPCNSAFVIFGNFENSFIIMSCSQTPDLEHLLELLPILAVILAPF